MNIRVHAYYIRYHKQNVMFRLCECVVSSWPLHMNLAPFSCVEHLIKYIWATTWENVRPDTVWSKSSLSAWRNFASLVIQNAPSKCTGSSESSLGARIWRHISDVATFITKTRPFKYTENFTSKNGKISDKKLWYFSYFCSKHRLWVLVRTASPRRF